MLHERPRTSALRLVLRAERQTKGADAARTATHIGITAGRVMSDAARRMFFNPFEERLLETTTVYGHIAITGPEGRRQPLGCEYFGKGAAARTATHIGIATMSSRLMTQAAVSCGEATDAEIRIYRICQNAWQWRNSRNRAIVVRYRFTVNIAIAGPEGRRQPLGCEYFGKGARTATHRHCDFAACMMRRCNA